MRWRDAPTNPREDTQRLADELLPTAKLLIERYGEILPMGALIGPEGNLEQVPCSEGIHECTVLAQAELLRQAFAQRAEEGELRASALIYDLAPSTEGNLPATGSLVLEIEHFTGHNVTMTIPYQKAPSGHAFLAPIMSDGAYRVFARRTG